MKIAPISYIIYNNKLEDIVCVRLCVFFFSILILIKPRNFNNDVTLYLLKKKKIKSYYFEGQKFLS